MQRLKENRKIEILTYVCDSRRHLVCYPFSIEGLHRIADELNINRDWFHRGDKPHYDIPKKRIDEIMPKCRVVSSSDIVRIIRGETIPILEI